MTDYQFLFLLGAVFLVAHEVTHGRKGRLPYGFMAFIMWTAAVLARWWPDL